MIGSYLGETATRLKRVFDYVRTTPCVLFFDEFDAVGKERGDIHETGEIKRVVTSLLMHVDELPSYAVVIAATNHSELLDRAVWRRFQFRLSLPAPSQTELIEYFDRFLTSFYKKPGNHGFHHRQTSRLYQLRRGGGFHARCTPRDVMTMKERPLKRTVEEQLMLWDKRVQPIRPSGTEDEVSDG